MNSKKNQKDDEKIIVRGARTHNLKNITVEMPRNKMIAITGLSGSGKSSLVFDTIFAEGQRRYIESLSAYARQFLRQMQKPDVDEIIGLSPAISIDQKSRSNNPRSTVATITEIYDYLRILFARIGKPHCLICGREIQKLTKEEIKELIFKNVANHKKDIEAVLHMYAPVVRGRKGEYYQLLYDLLNKGYSEVIIDGKKKSLREQIILAKNKKHDIDVLIDSVSLAEFANDRPSAEERISDALERSFDEAEGLIKLVFIGENGKELSGSGIISAHYACPYDGYSFPEIEPRLFSFNSPYGACPDCNGLGTKDFFSDGVCETCNGARLRKEALHVKVVDKSIVDIVRLSITDADAFFKNVPLTEKEHEISKVVIKEISSRLQFMLNVGIEYLSLDRKASTLSGGEAQRIRLASQLGSGLVGALYVLDEPTIGLHSRDNDRLIKTLIDLRDLGNTIIVVEHDEDTMYASDYIIDIGPGAGVHGGQVIVSGYLDELLTASKNASQSRTLAYLRHESEIAVPENRRTAPKGELKIRGANLFNIKNINIDIPLGKFIAVTGVSGSGKSTFMYEIVEKNLAARFESKKRTPVVHNCASFTGTEYVSRSVLIDQSPIGRTPRSNPATYTGAFTFIRDMFASTSEARARGWKPGRFSFNVPGGRCEACQGNGLIAVEMHFLPTVYVPCDVCHGMRYMKETLEVKYKNKNIHEIFKMTVEEALSFFEDIPAVYDRIKSLNDVGLGYLELGQSATTLSGGEAQRVKIASELYRPNVFKTVYLLDEPTIGLHYDDVKRLIEILQILVDKGNTVMVIEHNMDLIKSADYIIDIGPEGGTGGGKIVAKGTPEQVAQIEGSHTGKYLKRVLKKKKK